MKNSIKISIADLEKILELAKKEKTNFISLYKTSELFADIEVFAGNTKKLLTIK